MQRITAISGSLRRASYNSAALLAAMELAPPGVQIERVEIRDLPHYDDDLWQAGATPAVHAFRDAIARADAVLLVTPEYNYSIPGVLKNAIDWASRGTDQPFNGKPCAIMGASRGLIGTARGQYHLRQILVCMNAFAVNKPEVMIGGAADKFDASGALVNEDTRRLIAALLAELIRLAGKLR